MSRIVLGKLVFLVLLSCGFYGLVKVPAFAAEEKAAHEAAKPSAEGTIRVSVTFGQDGSVESCRVIRSNAPFALEASTVDHIRKHWKWPLFAGATEIVSLNFDTAPTAKYWDGEMATPPDLFPSDGQVHTMTLRLTFGSDGWVSSVAVSNPSGMDTVDQQTAIWIKVHWHHAAYANQVIDAPFEFKPPAPKKAPMAVAPPEPAEPVAIPAIRAQ